MSIVEKLRRAGRAQLWIKGARQLEAEMSEIEDRVHALIDDELEDFEHDEWPDGCPPKAAHHPLFQVALLLEQARGLVDERIEKLQESQT